MTSERLPPSPASLLQLQLQPPERSLDNFAEMPAYNLWSAHSASGFSSTYPSPDTSARASLSSSASVSSPSTAREPTEVELLKESEQLLGILDVVVAAETRVGLLAPPLRATRVETSAECTKRTGRLEGEDSDEDNDGDRDASVERRQHAHRTTRREQNAADRGNDTRSDHNNDTCPATVKRNKYREKTKLELEYLRTRTSELENELRVLQEDRGRPLSLARESHNAMVSSAWKRLAATQQRRRAESEAENEQLKREVRTYVEITRALSQTLSKRPSGSSFSAETLAKAKRSRGPNTHDADFFRDLVDGLDGAYARLDSVLQANGLDKVTREMRRTVYPKRARVAPSDLVEMCDVSVSPFDAWVNANAGWETTVKGLVHCKPGCLDRMWVSDSIIASRVRNEKDDRLWCRIAVKKYFDNANRFVTVWRAHTECKSDAFERYYLDETGWSVAEALTEQYPSGSIVRTCVHFQPRTKSSTSSLKSASASASSGIEAFADFILRSHDASMDELAEQVDSMLLSRRSGSQ